MAYADSAITDADDEAARLAVERTGRLQPAWDEYLGREAIPRSRTMDEWCDADAIDLMDGPDVFCWDDDEDFV